MKSRFRARDVSASVLGAGAFTAQVAKTLCFTGLLCQGHELVHHATARPVATARNSLVSRPYRVAPVSPGRTGSVI